MEQQNSELRSRLIEESKKTLMAEMTAKANAELTAKEISFEKDALEKKYQHAVQQINELNDMKEKYSQKMHEAIAQ